MFMLLTDLKKKTCFNVAQGPKSHFWGQTYPVKPLLILLNTFACHSSGKTGESDQNLLSWIKNDYSCEQPSANNHF